MFFEEVLKHVKIEEALDACKQMSMTGSCEDIPCMFCPGNYGLGGCTGSKWTIGRSRYVKDEMCKNNAIKWIKLHTSLFEEE